MLFNSFHFVTLQVARFGMITQVHEQVRLCLYINSFYVLVDTCISFFGIDKSFCMQIYFAAYLGTKNDRINIPAGEGIHFAQYGRVCFLCWGCQNGAFTFSPEIDTFIISILETQLNIFDIIILQYIYI